MSCHFFLVDAFSKQRFGGNPAAVCLLKSSISDDERFRLAKEINAPVTAFVEKNIDDQSFQTGDRFKLRWFSPVFELPLCGHATLATAHVLFNEIANSYSKLTFETKSGDISVFRNEDGSIGLDFPQWEVRTKDSPIGENNQLPCFAVFEVAVHLAHTFVFEEISIESVGHVSSAKRLIVVLKPETTKTQFESIRPNLKEMVSMHPDGRFVTGVIVTLAPKDAHAQGFVDSSGNPYDYVCRFFAPWEGNDEDPACGSAQCALGPFWSKRLNKTTMKAWMPYPNRGAEFQVSIPSDERVFICGYGRTQIAGELRL